jgi:hypothetical protein
MIIQDNLWSRLEVTELHFRRHLIVTLVVLSLSIGTLMTFHQSNDYGTDRDSLVGTDTEPIYQNIEQLNSKDFSISQATQEGVIDPVAIRQSGYQTTELKMGRTDTAVNTAGNISIDDTNGWFVNKTEIEITNIRRLYAVNGTFDDGTEPWVPYTIDGGFNTQLYSYNSSEGYIVCRNMGRYDNKNGGSYTHSQGSEIGWAQTVDNTPEALSFRIEFDFRYATGPIDPLGDDTFGGDIGVFWQLGSEGYYYPMQEYDSRETWYSVSYVFTVSPGTSSFPVYVGLYIGGGDVRVYVNTDYDDDPLGLPDGVANAQNVTLYIDNVDFTSITPPEFGNVDLTFHAGTFSAPVTGTGIGTASITNPDYWTANPLEFQITANASVIFTYSITSLFHRYINSSWSTTLSHYGVTYSIVSGESSEITFYTYVTQSSTYHDSTFDMLIPNDWNNVTVWDPLMNDITGLCEVTSGRIHVPTSELSRSGWWEINLNSLNYAKNVSLQVFDQTLGHWSENTLFRPGNDTRVQVEIGTLDTTPAEGAPTNISWLRPGGSLWALDSITTMTGGIVTSSVWSFGSTNTSAGEWSIDALWTNGTEIAFVSVPFVLYHSASITATYPSIDADYGLTISNLITLKDADTNEYLLDDGIIVEANWSNTVVAFSQNYAKNWWEADFDTSMLSSGLFIVVVNASIPYFDMVTTQFTVVLFFETTLEITNAGSIPIGKGLNEIFTVRLNYRLLNGTGVSGALPTVIHTGPEHGLKWNSFVDNNNGTYSLNIVCNISEIYGVTITLSKPFHYNATDSFTLIIGETGSELELLNGTADVVLYGGNYRLVVEYRNSTGQGLPGANLQVITVTPSSGISYTNFTPISGGYYEITFTPGSAGTFSIVIRASILNHVTQYATFTLTATGIPTILTSLPSSASIAINQTFVLQLRFQDESFNTINGSTITFVTPSGLVISPAIPAGNGLYNVTIQALEIKSFDLLFRASKNNYQSSSAVFILVVTEIQTSLRFAGDITSTTVPFSEVYDLTVYYEKTSPTTAVQGANITILPADITDLEFHVTEYTGYYVISIRGHAIGSWVLSIVANKTNHRLATKQFFIEIERIDTTYQGTSPFEALLVGRSYPFNFSYIFESNSSYIRGATILSLGDGADWISYTELGSGQYRVNLTPLELGNHYVLLTFEKTGFQTIQIRLTFTVDKVPIKVQVMDGLSGPELSESIILVRLSEVDTNMPASGVEVYCSITGPSGVPTSYPMAETSTPGEYSTVIMMPEAEGIYELEVTCDAVNYVLDTAFTVQLQPGRNIMTMLLVTTSRYYPIMLILAAVGVGLMYRRSARKRRVRQNKAALAVKRRFDDVKSILGVIVLHKDSGLPVYSKILRDGLEETVISAFITAITSFRGEFDIETTSEEWGLIPISDIVRVISTNRLVCAFITTGNPSPEQREKMIQFAKKVGFIFDETLGDIPIVILDQHTKMQFDALFEETLDGALLRTYKLDETKKLPTNTCANERIARKQGVEFKLEELASELAGCGLEEGRVYKAIMTALENHFLVTTDESPFASEIIRAPESVSDEG